jgi:hypothetical protein
VNAIHPDMHWVVPCATILLRQYFIEGEESDSEQLLRTRVLDPAAWKDRQALLGKAAQYCLIDNPRHVRTGTRRGARTNLPIRPTPIGIGTPDVESLTSYVQRIAAENCLPIDSMLQELSRIWSPGLSNYEDALQRWQTADFDASHVGALAAATGQSSDSLTRLSFSHIHQLLSSWTCYRDRQLSIDQFYHFPHSIIARNRRFCTLCLRNQNYYPLKWQFTEIKVCTQHNVLLQNKCPKCHSVLHFLTERSHPGRCDKCSFLLSNGTPHFGSESDVSSQAQADRSLDFLLTGELPVPSPNSLYNYSIRPDFGRRLEIIRSRGKQSSCWVSDYDMELIEKGELGIDFNVILELVHSFADSLPNFVNTTANDNWPSLTRTDTRARFRGNILFKDRMYGLKWLSPNLRCTFVESQDEYFYDDTDKTIPDQNESLETGDY